MTRPADVPLPQQHFLALTVQNAEFLFLSVKAPKGPKTYWWTVSSPSQYNILLVAYRGLVDWRAKVPSLGPRDGPSVHLTRVHTRLYSGELSALHSKGAFPPQRSRFTLSAFWIQTRLQKKWKRLIRFKKGHQFLVDVFVLFSMVAYLSLKSVNFHISSSLCCVPGCQWQRAHSCSHMKLPGVGEHVDLHAHMGCMCVCPSACVQSRAVV